MNATSTRRTIAASAATICLVAMWTVSARAAAAPGAPVGQCPPGYTLTDADFGPATMALDASRSGNHDGWICRKPFEHGPNTGIANIIDNDVPLGVTLP